MLLATQAQPAAPAAAVRSGYTALVVLGRPVRQRHSFIIGLDKLLNVRPLWHHPRLGLMRRRFYDSLDYCSGCNRSGISWCSCSISARRRTSDSFRQVCTSGVTGLIAPGHSSQVRPRPFNPVPWFIYVLAICIIAQPSNT